MSKPKKPYSLEYQTEACLIYSIIVAGKSADFADKKTDAFLNEIHKASKSKRDKLPRKMFRYMSVAWIEDCARKIKTGNYGKLAKACHALGEAEIDLLTCSPFDLEKIHGIGPKTSRFFIMWIRPAEIYAALDVHILRWLRNNGYPDAPKSTPPAGPIYERFEKAFIAEAVKRGKTPREFDYEIWTAGAGRTQETPLP